MRGFDGRRTWRTLRTSEAQLVAMAVMGNISRPALLSGYTLDNDGVGRVWPGMSGIVYNARVGDPAFGWAGDHVEPERFHANPDGPAEFALHYLSCMGNKAVVTGGLAKGAEGSSLANMPASWSTSRPEYTTCSASAIRSRSSRTGVVWPSTDFPQVELKKVSPALLHAMGITVVDGKLRVR
ncbi:MAG: DUF4438 domain-containing protein [Anaerolineae bacterium]